METGDFRCRNRNTSSSAFTTHPRWSPVFQDRKEEGKSSSPPPLLIHRSLHECARNSVNRDGAVLDLRLHPAGFALFRNGSLRLNNDPRRHLYSPDGYCLAFESVSRDGHSLEDAYVRLCPEEDSAGQTFLVTKAYPICCLVSNFFLLLTFLVYATLPELRRPLFGKLIMAFVASLFASYFFISLIALGHVDLIMAKAPGQEYSPTCRFLGFSVLFCFLHTFAWMNALSYDIFRKFTRFRRSSAKDQNDRARFLKYAAYALSVSSFGTAVAVTVELLPSEAYSGVRPGFGVDTCFFDSDLANFLFFQLYLITMQLVNVALFSATTRSMFRTWKATRKMGQHAGGGGGGRDNSSGSQRGGGGTNSATRKKKSVNDQIWIIVKLFVIMGVTWMSEFVNFLLGWIIGDDVVWKYTIFNDIINLSQGLLIFFVLVCKKKIFRRLRERLCVLVLKREPSSVGSFYQQQQQQQQQRQQQQHRSRTEQLRRHRQSLTRSTTHSLRENNAITVTTVSAQVDGLAAISPCSNHTVIAAVSPALLEFPPEETEIVREEEGDCDSLASDAPASAPAPGQGNNNILAVLTEEEGEEGGGFVDNKSECSSAAVEGSQGSNIGLDFAGDAGEKLADSGLEADRHSSSDSVTDRKEGSLTRKDN